MRREPLGLGLGWWLVATSRLWTARQKLLTAVAVPIPLATGVGIIVHIVLTFDIDSGGYISGWQLALFWIGFLSLFFVPAGLVIHLSRAATRQRGQGLVDQHHSAVKG